MSLPKTGPSVAQTGECSIPQGQQQQTQQLPASIVRTLLVHITGTPAMMDSLGGNTATWSLTEEQAVKIFAPKPNMAHDDALRQIKNVLLKRATLLGYRSTCDTVTSLQIDGLPGAHTHTPPLTFLHAHCSEEADRDVVADTTGSEFTQTGEVCILLPP
jgi:hypothetical protein